MRRLRQITNSFSEDGNQILSVEQFLTLPMPDELQSGKKNPLFMHSGMSRFYLSLTDKNQQVKGRNALVTANLPVEQVDALLVKIEALMALEVIGRPHKAVLYDSGNKYTSRKDKFERNTCYSLKCEYNGKAVRVRIRNFIAPLAGNEGLKTILYDKAECIITCDLQMSLDEWYRIVKKMADTKANFENLKFPSMFEFVEEHVSDNITA